MNQEKWKDGEILKHNTLWRLGMHYEFEFFMVSHVTPAGNVMGWPLSATKSIERMDHDSITSRWHVDTTQPTGRVKRLPHKGLWEEVEAKELTHGVRATSCLS